MLCGGAGRSFGSTPLPPAQTSARVRQESPRTQGLARTGRGSGPPPTPRSGASPSPPRAPRPPRSPALANPQPGRGFAQRAAWMPSRVKARATETQRRAPALLQAGALRGWGAPKSTPARPTACQSPRRQVADQGRQTVCGHQTPLRRCDEARPPVVFGQMRNSRSQPFQQNVGVHRRPSV
jgi:hypothetical protein